MVAIDTYIGDIKNLLDIGEFKSFQKRLIDLVLDTKKIEFYSQALTLLETPASSDNKTKYETFFNKVVDTLSQMTVPEPQLLFKVDSLRKEYSNSGFGLGPISFQMKEGEMIGLVGENGNGKTTLLRCLCRELQESAGLVQYYFPYSDNYDLRTKLVYIPQRTDTWHGSLLDNLRFTAACYGIKGEENKYLVDLMIHRMDLWRFRDYKWKNLSSGYKMRFELARMMLRTPKLLLIDEPLANLDILAQQIVLDDFRDIAKSPFRPLGIILSSQQLYAVESTSDQVIFLKEGKPRLLHNEVSDVKSASKNEANFVVEFECQQNFQQLTDLLQSIGLIKLQINGGTYVAQFGEGTSQNDFLSVFTQGNIHLEYYRDISNSTRRFFLS